MYLVNDQFKDDLREMDTFKAMKLSKLFCLSSKKGLL